MYIIFEKVFYSIRISDFTTLTSTMQFAFKTSDIEPMGNITEAAIDHFYVAEADELSLEEGDYTSYSIYPNPVVKMILFFASLQTIQFG